MPLRLGDRVILRRGVRRNDAYFDAGTTGTVDVIHKNLVRVSLDEVAFSSGNRTQIIIWQGSQVRDLSADLGVPEPVIGERPVELQRPTVAATRPAGARDLDEGLRLSEGMRVVLVRDVERFPDFIARAGLTGVVTKCGPVVYIVKMDVIVPGAQGWGNTVEWVTPEQDPYQDLAEVTAAPSPFGKRDLDF